MTWMPVSVLIWLSALGSLSSGGRMRRLVVQVAAILVMAGCASAESEFTRAEMLVTEGKYLEAVEVLDALAAKWPDSPEAKEKVFDTKRDALMARAVVSFQAGDMAGMKAVVMPLVEHAKGWHDCGERCVPDVLDRWSVSTPAARKLRAPDQDRLGGVLMFLARADEHPDQVVLEGRTGLLHVARHEPLSGEVKGWMCEHWKETRSYQVCSRYDTSEPTLDAACEGVRQVGSLCPEVQGEVAALLERHSAGCSRWYTMLTPPGGNPDPYHYPDRASCDAGRLEWLRSGVAATASECRCEK